MLFPNCGTPYRSFEYLTKSADFVMFEGGSDIRNATGSARRPLVGGLSHRLYYQHIAEYRYSAGVPGSLAPMLLKRTRTRDGVKLSMAEAAVFGSGAANGVTPGWRDRARPYLAFFREHPELYADSVSAADVAVLFWPGQSYYPGSRHFTYARKLIDTLAALCVPFDCVSEPAFSEATLAAYRVVVAPHLAYVSDEQVSILRRFVEKGGTLVAIGPFGTHDAFCRPRQAKPLTAKAAPPPARRGVGVRPFKDWPPRSELLKAIGRPAGGSPAWTGLRTMIYARDRAPRGYIVHLLNYNVNADPKRREPTIPLRDVRVVLRLPAGAKPTRVRVFDPERPRPRELPFSRQAEGLRFTVPEVPIYRICLIEIAGG